MKKRRELDALVSNGKLGRSRKPKLKKGEHELLRNESGSSEEEFSLPAQKTVSRKRGPSRFCSTCLTVCGFLLLVACIVACGGLIWMHLGLKRELDQLRGQIRSVVSGTKGSTDELQSIQSKLATLERTVDGYKTGNNGLDRITKNISSIIKQIGTLNQSSEQLQKSVAAAPELKNLPSTVADLSKNVASMGSEIKTLQSRIEGLETFQKEISADMDGLKVKVVDLAKGNTDGSETQPSSPAPAVGGASDALNKYYAEQFHQVQTSVTVMNASLWQKFISMNSSMSQHTVGLAALKNETDMLGTRMELLELKGTSKTGSNVSAGDMKTLIQAAVNSAVGQLGNMSSQQNHKQNAVYRNIYIQIDNITSLVQTFQTQLNQLKVDQEAMNKDKVNLNVTAGVMDIINNQFRLQENQWEEDIKHVKGLIRQMNQTVISLSATVEQHKGMIMNTQPGVEISSTIPSTSLHASEGPSLTDRPPSTTPQAQPGVGGLEGSSTLLPGDSSDNVSVSTTPIPAGGQSSQPANLTLNETVSSHLNASGPSTTLKPTAGVSWIKTSEDMETNFYRWDQDGDGFVDFDSLPDFMGPQTPSKELLLSYDENKDGRWTLPEMRKAFGFPPVTTTAPVQDGALNQPVEGGAPVKRNSNDQPDKLHEIVKALQGGA